MDKENLMLIEVKVIYSNIVYVYFTHAKSPDDTITVTSVRRATTQQAIKLNQRMVVRWGSPEIRILPSGSVKVSHKVNSNYD